MTKKPHEDWPLSSSYGEWYKQKMNAFEEGLWHHLEAVPLLEPEIRDGVICYLLELACQAQHIANISLGRMALRALPRDWLLQNIERYAEPLLELEDEWEYRRLLEVYEHLDDDLVHRLAVRGLTSPQSGIREVGQEWLE
jgi:hypothetical protein